MTETIFRAEICGLGATNEDAEAAWKLNVARVMAAVKKCFDKTKTDHVEFFQAIEEMLHIFNAASNPRQEEAWSEKVLALLNETDRIVNSHGGTDANSSLPSA